MHAAAYIYFLLGLPLHTQPTALQHWRPPPQAATSLLRKERRHISASDCIQPASMQSEEGALTPGHFTKQLRKKATSEPTTHRALGQPACTAAHACTETSTHDINQGSGYSLVHHPRQPRTLLFQPGWVETRARLSKHTGCTWVSDQQHCAALHKQHCNHQISRHKPPKTTLDTTLLARQPTITKLAQGPS
jgi:hypothetical protein